LFFTAHHQPRPNPAPHQTCQAPKRPQPSQNPYQHRRYLFPKLGIPPSATLYNGSRVTNRNRKSERKGKPTHFTASNSFPNNTLRVTHVLSIG
jgi:hypothetical protein